MESSLCFNQSVTDLKESADDVARGDVQDFEPVKYQKGDKEELDEEEDDDGDEEEEEEAEADGLVCLDDPGDELASHSSSSSELVLSE